MPRLPANWYLRAVLAERLVVVADAHLGATPPEVEHGLLAFLEAVPCLGDALLVNGDLFDFWFSYARVIPRHGFHVAAALARLRRTVPIIMVGGNHDRWDADFWRNDLGVDFAPERARFDLGRRRVLAVHGDGLTEPRWSAALLHRVISHRATAAIYRSLHPDRGFRLVERLAPSLGDKNHGEAAVSAAAERQQAWAAEAMRADASVDLLVMGHTHRAALTEIEAGRWYLNPGAWFDGCRYAVVTESGVELRQFEVPA
ncbi:MAG: UDP-2,3-diacylglucosamine diphosphatase [Gemmatimonadota bacterium]|nr:UDP-2,3-diacylglucosamine diphosphatase [Gemmatimonadota bacterium]